jgi:hypothetical protein
VREKLLKHQKNLISKKDLQKSNSKKKLSNSSSFQDIESSILNVTDAISEVQKDMIIEIFYNLDLWSGFDHINM